MLHHDVWMIRMMRRMLRAAGKSHKSKMKGGWCREWMVMWIRSYRERRGGLRLLEILQRFMKSGGEDEWGAKNTIRFFRSFVMYIRVHINKVHGFRWMLHRCLSKMVSLSSFMTTCSQRLKCWQSVSTSIIPNGNQAGEDESCIRKKLMIGMMMMIGSYHEGI